MKANEIMNKVNNAINKANEELKAIVAEGFPFSFEEVELTAEMDSAGIYVHSGKTPVCAVARMGDPLLVLREVEDDIARVVDNTRTAVERRGKLKSEHDELVSADKVVKVAKAALEAQNLPVDILDVGVEAKAIVAAARKAVKAANRGLYLFYSRAVEAMGGLKSARLAVKGYAGGIVITAGGKACLITRFPKSGSAKTMERMLQFIAADVATLGESRMAYMAKLEKALLHEEQLHEIAKRFDAANEALAACR